MSGLLQFIRHYIDVVERGVNFFGAPGIVTMQTAMIVAASDAFTEKFLIATKCTEIKNLIASS